MLKSNIPMPTPPGGGGDDGDGDDKKIITITVPAGATVVVTGAPAPDQAPGAAGEEDDHLRALREAALADEAHQARLDRKLGRRLR